MLNTVNMDLPALNRILRGIKEITVATIGDMCLDFYVYADMKKSKLSRETPHYPLPVVRETATPGGGGNVVNNINALGVKALRPVSLLGNDWRGFMLEKYLNDNGFDTSYLVRSDDFITTCYLKPMRMGISDVVYEDPRLDFENREPIGKENEEKILLSLKKAVQGADVLVVSDQMSNGIITDRIRKEISLIAKAMPVVMDSRENSGLYSGVIAKPNEVEAAIMAGRDINNLDLSTDELAGIGGELSIKNKCPVIVTLGSRGALWCENGEATLAPTVKAEPPVDFVGAGDTFLSAVSCALAAGADGAEALCFANLASGVTVKKIGTTGTASPDEILAKYKENSRK